MTTAVATHKGVPQSTETEAVEATPRPLSPRDQRLAEIVARRNEEQTEDVETTRRMREAEGLEPEQAAGEAEAEGSPTAEGKQPIARQEPAPEPAQKIRLKVDGRDLELSMDEVIRRAQKDVAADTRLAQATESKRQADALVHQNAALNQELQRHLATVRAVPETHGAEVAEGEIQGLIDALLDGKVDQAKKGFQKLLSGRQTATPDVSQITASVKATLRSEMAAESAADAEARSQRELVEGLNVFRTKYADIANDPRLFAYANAETDLIAQENPNLAPAEIFLKAGERVTEMLRSKGQPQPITKQDLKSRLERPVVGANSPAQLGEKTPPPVTTQSVIARMRASRGQQ